MENFHQVQWVFLYLVKPCSSLLPIPPLIFLLSSETEWIGLLCSFLFFFFLLMFLLNALKCFRYGPIFRTSLVGRPLIVSTDPDLNYYIFQEEGQLFQSWYPDTFTEIFGRQNVGSLHGFMYKYLKNMVLHLFGPESLRKMIPEVEAVATQRLRQWSSQNSVELKDNTASVITYSNILVNNCMF